MPLLLTREDVQPLLDLPEAIEVTESAFREQAEGQVAVHAPYHIGVKGDQALRVVSGALLRSRRVGVRLGPNVQLAGGDRMCALLFDAESGDLLSIMGYPFGTLRIAATIALAAKQLAREDAKKVGLFGIGRNALGLLKGRAEKEELLRERRVQPAGGSSAGGAGRGGGTRHGYHTHCHQCADAGLSGGVDGARGARQQHGKTERAGSRGFAQGRSHRGRKPGA
ncbi:MAG: hypothetical protein HYY83_07725 [Deltaproteobacteria bacterium]|nr:hypothetical protein [Deltaproteobacteria bacterium]